MCFLLLTPTQAEPCPPEAESPSFLSWAIKVPAEIQKLLLPQPGEVWPADSSQAKALQPELPPPSLPPCAQRDAARTHAVLQRDVGAQPDVIQGQLSWVAVADKSLKHDLWEIGTEMSVLSWALPSLEPPTESGCCSQRKGWEIAPGFPYRPVDHLTLVLLPCPASASLFPGKVAVPGQIQQRDLCLAWQLLACNFFS